MNFQLLADIILKGIDEVKQKAFLTMKYKNLQMLLST